MNPRQITRLRGLFGIPPDLGTSGRQIYSVVATIPDPLHTRLALSFDVIIDAIERAAESQGWTFAREWLPWLDPASGPEDDIGERRHQRSLEREQEMFPGLLIFRQSFGEARDVLFVFLVPESPTSSISGDPFYAALNFANLLPSANSKTEIGLLAPTFSGSFRSLTRLLEPWMKGPRAGPQLHRTIFGGQISSSEDAAKFSKDLKVDFRSGIVSSGDYKRTFECEILPHYRLNRTEVAYLVELESGFAAKFSRAFSNPKDEASNQLKDEPNPCPESAERVPLVPLIHQYRFPRDVAHLRNAYREASQSPGFCPASILL